MQAKRAKQKRKIRLGWIIAGAVGFVLLGLVVTACIVPIRFSLGNTIIYLGGEVVKPQDPFSRAGVFIRTGWDGPTGSFSHGNIFGLKIGSRMLRLEIIEDPLAAAEKKLPKTIEGLFGAIDAKDRWVRLRAFQILAELGPAAKGAVPALLLRMESGDEQAGACLDAICKATGPEVVPALAAALRNSRQPRVRAKAAEWLGEFGPAAQGAAPFLKVRLLDVVPQVALQCAIALRRTGDPAEEALPVVLKYLGHEDVEVQRMAAVAAGELGSMAAQAVPGLIRSLEHTNAQVRAMSARALGLIGPAAAPAVMNLIARLDDQNGDVLMWSIRSLGLLGKEAASAIPKLAEFAAKEQRESQWALEALGGMGPEAARRLLTIYEKANGLQRYLAARALMQLGPDAAAAAPALIKDLSNADAGRVMLSAQVLGCLGEKGQTALPRLTELLRHPDPGVQVRAAHAVWKISGQREIAYPLLTSALKASPKTGLQARRYAAEALGDMGPVASNAVPLLEAMLNDPQPGIRQTAAAALNKINSPAKKSAKK